MSLQEYLKANFIPFEEDQFSDSLFYINGKKFYYQKPNEEGIIFNEDFDLLVDDVACDYYCYEFGKRFYYIESDKTAHIKLKPLKYIGTYETGLDDNFIFPYLGIHGRYEILNGSRDYQDWINKAKFLKIKTIGICEKNTLAGSISFQLQCVKNNIKPIIGYTATVKIDANTTSDIRFYAENEIGWSNLLRIHKEVAILNNGYIELSRLLLLNDGLACVILPQSMLFDKLTINKLRSKFSHLFYQIDTVIFEENDYDEWYLKNLNKYLKTDLKPVLINDSYYLDKEDSHVKIILNSIASKGEHTSKNQYFKTIEENYELLHKLFGDEDRRDLLFSDSLDNLNELANNCNFLIDTKNRHLPKYIMSPKQSEKYGDDLEQLFWDIIESNSHLIPEGKEEQYLARIEYEFNVIKGGNVLDYFMIIWDLIRWCNDEGILIGHARGSAAGSAITYFLGISKVDPIKWDLLFERFISVSRLVKSLPDIDLDFQPSHRESVKNYLRQKYGINQFCYIGSYTTIQIKGAIKELARLEGVEFQKINYLTTIIDFEDYENGTIEDLFRNSLKKPQLKEFIQQYPYLINDIFLIFNAIKAESIHACATLTVPDDKEIYDQIPCRWASKEGEEILVSQWEGEEIADSGYLKNDILGIEQLDKYKFCLDLIKETTGKEIDIYNLPLDDENVLDLFRKGYNSDIFQFGSPGLTGYCKDLQPDSIDELIDATALYRPGSMDVNSHNEYVFRKNGKSNIKYNWGLKEITESTKGLLVYQEQCMLAFVAVGGFDMIEADDIRKAIVKKRNELIQGYKTRFFEGASKKGCPEEEIAEIWHLIEVHGGYSFNKSHAVSYTLISWVGQWLKYYYPIQFWTTALQYSKNEVEVAKYISEINKLESIKVLSPNINGSEDKFSTNFEKAEIYWSLAKIKQCGEVAVQNIMEERNKNGVFFSFSEFIKRIQPVKSKINKRIVINLIIAGAFDELEDLKQPRERAKLIDDYYKLTGNKRDKDDEFLNTPYITKDWWWTLRQRSITGYGIINYRSLIKQSQLLNDYLNQYVDATVFFEEGNEGKDVVIGGIVNEVRVRDNKKGEYAHISIESNNEVINCTVWSEQYDMVKKQLEDVEGKIILLRGSCKYDNYRKTQAIQSNESFLIEILN